MENSFIMTKERKKITDFFISIVDRLKEKFKLYQ